MTQSFSVVVADCGGTNSRLQLYAVAPEQALSLPPRRSRAPGTLVYEAEFQNQVYIKVGKTFTHIFQDFLTAANHADKCVTVASIAVAGPVSNNAVEFTNNGWSISGKALEKTFGIARVFLMNDFVANGYGLLTLDEKKPEELRVIQHAEAVPGAPIACLGPGTGLGETYLTSTSGDDGYHAFPSEGGHSEFAPRNDLEFQLLKFLMQKFKEKHRVSVERVISGRGLANVYEFLCAHPDHKTEVDNAVKAAFDAAGDLKGKVVADHYGKDALCTTAMKIFITAFGAEAGVCGLKWLPFGGLYLAGGLTPKNIDLIDQKGSDSCFLAAFRDKGRLSPQLLKIPVYAVMDQALGQRGAHFMAVKLLRARILVDQDKAAAAATTSTATPSPSTCPAWNANTIAPLCFLAGAVTAVIASRVLRR